MPIQGNQFPSQQDPNLQFLMSGALCSMPSLLREVLGCASSRCSSSTLFTSISSQSITNKQKNTTKVQEMASKRSSFSAHLSSLPAACLVGIPSAVLSVKKCGGIENILYTNRTLNILLYDLISFFFLNY